MASFSEYIGIAAQTLMGDDPVDLEVIIPDLLPMLEGDVTEEDLNENTKKSISVQNYAIDSVSETTIKPSSTFKCKYLGIRTNMSMPNIHLGEQIRVFHFKNTDQFYWAPLGRDDAIRKTEHLKMKIANKKVTNGELDDDTTYFIEMDTRSGQRKIHIHTSSGTDEEVTYDLLIDTDKSEVSLLDSNGNGMHWKSKEYWMKYFNNNGCFHEIDKDNIHHHAVDTYKVTAKHYVRETEEDDTITTQVTKRVSSDSIETETTSDKLTAETQQNDVSTATLYTTPVFGISGALLLGGALSSGAGSVPATPAALASATPSANEVIGDVGVTGKVTASDEVTGNGVELSTHDHDFTNADGNTDTTEAPN